MKPEKSAEEWAIERSESPLAEELVYSSMDVQLAEFAQFIEQVKRNAKHAAMLEAAEISEQTPTEDSHPLAVMMGGTIQQAILTAAKKYED